MTLGPQGKNYLEYMVYKMEETIKTMFSKISLNVVNVGFCYHGNIQSFCCTCCLKCAFQSLIIVLLVDMNCFEVYIWEKHYIIIYMDIYPENKMKLNNVS